MRHLAIIVVLAAADGYYARICTSIAMLGNLSVLYVVSSGTAPWPDGGGRIKEGRRLYELLPLRTFRWFKVCSFSTLSLADWCHCWTDIWWSTPDVDQNRRHCLVDHRRPWTGRLDEGER